jgi:rhamnogalacturonyl hydrolase YesR
LKLQKKTTDFLIANCQENNFPAPIGCNGWYIRGKNKALFDQQPIDAGYMVCCLEKAYYATKDSFYLTWAKKWYKWFWGYNIKNTSLIDENFACYDGLNSEGVNLNQGAESNICFLMAYLAARRLGIVK